MQPLINNSDSNVINPIDQPVTWPVCGYWIGKSNKI